MNIEYWGNRKIIELRHCVVTVLFDQQDKFLMNTSGRCRVFPAVVGVWCVCVCGLNMTIFDGMRYNLNDLS